MIIFIHGEDIYSSKKYLDAIIEKFKSKHGNNVSVFDAEESVWGDISASFSANDLFGNKKLLILKNILSNKETRDSLLSFLDNSFLDQNTTLVVHESGAADKRNALTKKLALEKFNKEFSLSSPFQIEKIIEAEIQKLGKKIEPQAKSNLASFVGINPARAASEAQKLANLPISVIDENIVKENTLQNQEDDIWQFIDSISSGQKKLALSLLEKQFFMGAEPLYLLKMVIRQIRLILSLSGASGTEKDLASDLKIHPFVVKKTRAQARGFSKKRLVVFYQSLVRLDRALKRGKVNPRVLFFVLMDTIVK